MSGMTYWDRQLKCSRSLYNETMDTKEAKTKEPCIQKYKHLEINRADFEIILKALKMVMLKLKNKRISNIEAKLA